MVSQKRCIVVPIIKISVLMLMELKPLIKRTIQKQVVTETFKASASARRPSSSVSLRNPAKGSTGTP